MVCEFGLISVFLWSTSFWASDLPPHAATTFTTTTASNFPIRQIPQNLQKTGTGGILVGLKLCKSESRAKREDRKEQSLDNSICLFRDDQPLRYHVSTLQFVFRHSLVSR